MHNHGPKHRLLETKQPRSRSLTTWSAGKTVPLIQAPQSLRAPRPLGMVAIDYRPVCGKPTLHIRLAGGTMRAVFRVNARKSIFLILIAVIASLIHTYSGANEAALTGEDAAAQCKALRTVDFSFVLDAPTQINESKWIDATHGAPEFCQVKGYIAPAVGFELRLPTKNWNGKFIEIGCGGNCGTIIRAFRGEGCEGPLHRGYACIVSDQGHEGSGVLWAQNNPQAVIDLAFRSTHVAAVAGKAIVEHYYSHVPTKSYFMGCSGGGREAMMEAQRFPWDFDGIIAGAPSLAPPRNVMDWLWANRQMTDRSVVPALGKSQLDLVHQSVIEKCDLNDGVKDGLIGDPRGCNFDPATLLCGAGRKGQCLTAQQVALVKTIYGSPMNSSGVPLSLPFAMKGTEHYWLDFFAGPATYDVLRSGNTLYGLSDAGPNWKPEDFDFDRDYKRLGGSDALYSARNPDLRQFKGRGGKLLSYTGWYDLTWQLRTVDYYETVEKTMGGRAATQDFFRLFVIPGMRHCTGGDGAYAIDYLSYLEAWVERGTPPDKLVGAHVNEKYLEAQPNPFSFVSEDPQENWYLAALTLMFPLGPEVPITFTRPFYPYPTETRYLGHGDPNDAASFGPAPVQHNASRSSE